MPTAQPHGDEMTFCQEWSLVKREEKRVEAEPLYCRSWRCDVCAPGRKNQLMAEAFAGQPTTFLTLTHIRRPGDNPNLIAKDLARAFQILMKRIKRKLGKTRIPYLAVFEATKQGWPHLHVLLRMPYVEQAWISEQMDQLVGSPIVDIRRITNQKRAAWYVAKYAGKEPHKFGTCKRYWQTQDYDLRGDDADPRQERGTGRWQPENQSVLGLAHQLQAQGWQLQWEKDCLTATWPWPTQPP